MGLCLLSQSSMPSVYLWEAFSSFVFLINRFPAYVLSLQCPYHIQINNIHDYVFFKRFNCSYFPFLRPYNSHKFSFHTNNGVFVGFSDSHKGYKCMDKSGRVYLSKSVVFNEAEFHFISSFRMSKSSNTLSNQVYSDNPFVILKNKLSHVFNFISLNIPNASPIRPISFTMLNLFLL